MQIYWDRFHNATELVQVFMLLVPLAAWLGLLVCIYFCCKIRRPKTCTELLEHNHILNKKLVQGFKNNKTRQT